MSSNKPFIDNLKITPVILAGGTGTRLWPLSRESYPKQFLKLMSTRSLLQETILRVQTLENIEAPIIISNEAHYFLCLEQLQEIQVSSATFILEPFGKNTAPAIACAAHHLSNRSDSTDLMLVMPSDHHIADTMRFSEAIKIASEAAYNNQLITFGVTPTAPKTGYGYIERSEPIFSNVYKIKKFIEKPLLEVAEKLITNCHVFWNSGIFLFKPESYLEELKHYAPDIYLHSLDTYKSSQKKSEQNYIALNRACFAQCPNNSIDYAVMEKTQQAAIVPLHSDWNDLGCWTTVAESLTLDTDSNVINGNVFAIQTENCLLSSETHLVATLGIKNQIVVSTEDAVLVADKAYSQEVKRLVSELKNSHNHLTRHHQKTYHPWGYCESLTKNKKFQINYIFVKLEAKFCLHLNYHAAVHWIIVSGSVKISNGNKVFHLTTNQSLFISKEHKYYLSNVGEEFLHMIEIHVGDQLEEYDIERYKDIHSSKPLSELENVSRM